jgi:uncharacterized membrane protein
MTLSAIVGAFVSAGNFVIPLFAFLVALILMFFLKKNLKEKLTDEMIEKIAGKVSRIVMTASILIMAIAGIVLISLREKFPQYLVVGYAFAYFVCAMLIAHSILFKFFLNKKI